MTDFNLFLCRNRVTEACINRRLIKTQQGYLGISSMEAKPGDRVCILFGSQVPVVLRADGENWKVIGEAYVHGIMDSEALRGDPKARTFVLC
jgi:hypothetical protein